MIVVFMRHGRAEEKRAGVSDEERRLTDGGRRDVELIAKLLPPVRIVYTSPLRRAVETGEIVARVHGAELRVVDELRPGTTLAKLLGLGLGDRSLLVGHAPSIEDVVEELLGFRVRMPAGSAAVLSAQELGRGSGELLMFLTPRIAREIVDRLAL
ncbi:MAG: hypothetical protein DRO39_00020 [Thermoprotei archaeon]|nr:MAG: hypothetical protein DRO39_00020 [Thermoprotei archaeon]